MDGSVVFFMMIAVIGIIAAVNDKKNKQRRKRRIEDMAKQLETQIDIRTQKAEQPSSMQSDTRSTTVTDTQVARDANKTRKQVFEEAEVVDINMRHSDADVQQSVKSTVKVPNKPQIRAKAGDNGLQHNPQPSNENNAEQGADFEFDARRAVIDSEILRPKYQDYD